jgi:trigger factor
VTVTKNVERLEHSAIKLTLTVGKDDLRSEYDEIVANYAKSIQIPGFRKGKVPRDVLVRKFSEAFNAETLAHVMEHSVSETFADESFPPEDRPLAYSTPQADDEPAELDLEQDLKFSVTYDVLPTVIVGKWQGLEVTVKDAEIGEEDLARELEAIRERNAIVLDKDDGAEAVQGDVVTVNYAELALGEPPTSGGQLSPAGEVIEGTERQDFVFTLGTGYNVFHFDDDVVGMKKGETKTFDKIYPEDSSDAELAGKTKKLRVTLTALKERRLPELDDDLAQDVDEKYQTLEDLKKDIRERLTKNLDNRRRDLRISAILEKVLEVTPIDIPESMIRIELDGRWRAMARQFNADPEQLTEMMNRSERGKDTIFEEWRPPAIKALQSRLIVETLIKERGYDAADEEVEAALERIAAETNSSLEDVKSYYSQDTMKEYVKEDIKEQKLYDLLLAENTIKPGEKVKYLDLLSNNG